MPSRASPGHRAVRYLPIAQARSGGRRVPIPQATHALTAVIRERCSRPHLPKLSARRVPRSTATWACSCPLSRRGGSRRGLLRGGRRSSRICNPSRGRSSVGGSVRSISPTRRCCARNSASTMTGAADASPRRGSCASTGARSRRPREVLLPSSMSPARIPWNNPRDRFGWYKIARAFPAGFQTLNKVGWVAVDDPTAPSWSTR